MLGKIKWFNDARGFGRIYTEENGGIDEIFFHKSDINDFDRAKPSENDNVTFDIIENPKGNAAKNITRVWTPGIIMHVNAQKNFGFIYNTADSDGIHFRSQDYSENTKDNPKEKNYVAFSNISKSGKGQSTSNIINIQKMYGTIVSFDKNGQNAKILPTNSTDPISVGPNDAF